MDQVSPYPERNVRQAAHYLAHGLQSYRNDLAAAGLHYIPFEFVDKLLFTTQELLEKGLSNLEVRDDET